MLVDANGAPQSPAMAGVNAADIATARSCSPAAEYGSAEYGSADGVMRVRANAWSVAANARAIAYHAATARTHPMNTMLWVLQILGAFVYAASGVMKVLMFDKVSADVPSFGALPRNVWMALGIIELACVVGLIVPAALHWHPTLTVVAAAVLALESLVFIRVHVKYRETPAIVMSAVLGLLMALLAYGRMVLQPIG